MQKKFRIPSAITAGSLALTAIVISVSSGTSQTPVHAALAARTESVPAVTSAGMPPGQLDPGQEITSGTQIVSPNGEFVLQMQSDGNLVLRAPGNTPLGSTNTAGDDGAIAVMQADGNFVLRAPGNIPVWASGTDGHPGTVLQVQDDGNVVLYAPGHQALRVLFPAVPNPQNSAPAPAAGSATAPATAPGTSDGSGGANTSPANTAPPATPGTTSGSNSGHIGPGYTSTPGGVRCVQGAVGVIMDGHYGQATYTAVKQFQASHGLTVDGIVGPTTGDVIIAALPDAVRFDCARVVPTTVSIMDDHGNIATGGTAYNEGPNGDPGAAIDNGKPLGTCLANGIKGAIEGPGRASRSSGSDGFQRPRSGRRRRIRGFSRAA